MQNEFPFLKAVQGSDSVVLCSLCDGKFSVADSGRKQINQHLNTQKHIKGAKTVEVNKPITSFLQSQPAKMELERKELTFAFHFGKHRMSKRTADCTSKLVNKLFDSQFTCGATKSTKLVQKVIILNLIVQDQINLQFHFTGNFTGD